MVELTLGHRRNLKDELPDEAGRIAFCQPKPEIPTGTLKESDITWEHSNALVDITAEQIVNSLQMRFRPMICADQSGPGKSPAYLRFVVSSVHRCGGQS
uniref:Uncharacterized protein n=1 Tax=Salmonella sp. TaxID=599 RepID=A0A482ET85_SALSP|nr:hypothetical protein [Salmonella sp.]QBM91407.1 hypothetical protein NNIBIDOC_00077 [Salmonella sp.]